MANSSDPPVGTVLAFAGLTLDQNSGWMLCRGQTLSNDQYNELYLAIGYANGSDGSGSNFLLPNYSGMFLRGRDGNGTQDPDSSSRTAPANGANSGNNVGSMQEFATGQPNAAFTVNVYSLPTGGHHTDGGSDVTLTKYNSDTETKNLTQTGGTAGFDKESRPVNVYVNYIIKYSSQEASGVPVGTIMAFPGKPGNSTLQSSGWLACDGSAYTNSSYQDLFDVIAQSVGNGGQQSEFCVPDLRGRFLRGQDNGTGNDPDATSRTALTSSGNATGDAPLTLQQCATGAPASPFNVLLDHLPQSKHTADTIDTSKDCVDWYTSHNLVVTGGGDSESRPKNIYVYWYIKAASSS